MRFRVHSKTGKPFRRNGITFTSEPQEIDTEGWTPEQVDELLSPEVSEALHVEHDGKTGRTDGPTLEEWLKAGRKAANYPPKGYLIKRSPMLGEFRAAQRAAREAAVKPKWSDADLDAVKPGTPEEAIVAAEIAGVSLPGVDNTTRAEPTSTAEEPHKRRGR